MFIEKTLKFIEESDLSVSLPDIRQVTENDEGNYIIHMSSICRLSENKLKENYLLSQVVIFTLFDAIIDIKYPNLDGLSFKRRYEGLPSTNNFENIFREVYRVLKLIRNATIHNRSSLNRDESGVQLRYTHRNTNFEFNCSSKAISILNTIVILLAKSFDVRDKYTETLLVAYFNDLTIEVSNISDEFQNSLLPITVPFTFKWSVRYRITNPKFNYYFETNSYKLENRYKINENEVYASDEYILHIHEDKYLIPGEVINENGEFTKRELLKWKVFGNN